MAAFNPLGYLNTYEDIRDAYENYKEAGSQAGEEGFLNQLKSYGTKEGSDVGDYTAEEFARAHYDLHGSPAGKTPRIERDQYIKNYNTKDFEQKLSQLRDTAFTGAIGQDVADDITRNMYEQYYQQGPDIGTFETMLKKLTGSKMKQQGQIAAARRGDIYAGGLANMMGNF